MERDLETRRAGIERTLTAVLRGPVTAGLVARDSAVSLSGWAADAMRVLHDRLSEGLEEARETGRVTLTELRAVPTTPANAIDHGVEHAVGNGAAAASDSRFASRRAAPAGPAPSLRPVEAATSAVPSRTSANGAGSTHGAASPPPPGSITDYDQLSALQVIQRLDGLAGPELDEVRAYETSRRGRRTILAKIDQLQRSA